MKEEELLEWIDETLSGTRSVISHLVMNAQMMPLDLMEEKAYRNADRQIAILNALKRVVINWYQMGEGSEGGEVSHEDTLCDGITECRWCGGETLLVHANWKSAPDDPEEDVITLTVWCQNPDCKFGRRGFGVRIEKE